MEASSPIILKFYSKLLYVILIFIFFLILFNFILFKQLKRTTEILQEKNNLSIVEQQQQEIKILESRIKNKIPILGQEPLKAIATLNQQLSSRLKSTNLDNIKNLLLTEADKQKIVLNLNIISEDKKITGGFIGSVDDLVNLLDLLRYERYAFILNRLDLKKEVNGYLINFSLTFQ